MIHLYDFDNTDYEKNGDYDISNIVVEDDYDSGNINEIPTYKISVTTEDNELWKQIVENKIIKIETPYGDDLFRIEETEVSSEDYILDIYTKQIFSDCSKTLAKDLNNDNIYICETGNVTGQGALNKIFNGTKFKGHSNITTIYNTRWERKTITEALIGDSDNSFVNKYGGELYVNKFDVTINDKVGSDKGVEILYGKNIAGITKRVDFTGVITRIVPVGYNGLRLTGKTPYVDSPLINKYPFIREQVIEFSDVKVKEDDSEGFATEELARQELIRLSKLMFSEQHIDTPNVNIKIDMIDLSKTEEYKNYRQLETVLKGDTVHCRHSKLNITTDARCLNFHYSAKSKKIISIEIGDVTESYFQNQIDLSNKLQKILDGDKVKASMMAGILNGLQTKFIAQYNIAEKQHVRAMLFEDEDPNSPNFGAVCIGSMGIELASKKTADGRAWDWKTFITGGVVRAELLIGALMTVLITNADGSFKLDLRKNGGCDFYSNGNKALSIFSSAMRFYNFGKSTEELIGAIATTLRYNGDVLDPNKSFIELFHEPNSMMSLGYRDKTDGRIRSYMEFDTYGNGDNDCSISFFKDARFSNSILDMRGNRIYLNKYKYPGLYLTTSTTGWLWCNGSFVTTGNFECKGDKNCIQHTDEYGDIKFSSIEDIGAYLTWREYDAFKEECIYETKKSKYSTDEYYSCIVEIPDIIQQTIDTTGQYDVDINVIKSFANARLWTIGKEYFLVKSDKPCKFNFVLTGRRKGFETRSLEEQLIEAEKYKAKEKEKENKDMILKARINKYFKHNKRDFKLWQQCGEEWIANDGICDEG